MLDESDCAAAGRTEGEVTLQMVDAIRRRLAIVQQDGIAVAAPTSSHREVFVTDETPDAGVEMRSE